MEKLSQWILGFKKAISGILALVSLIGSGFVGVIAEIPEHLAPGVHLSYSLNDGISMGQGLATDGEYYYGFGALKILYYNAITKISVQTGEIVGKNEMCIPPELMLKGYCHLGDGCVSDGKLYIACEDVGFRNPAVLVYDADTLVFDSYFTIPSSQRGDGHLPWCTISDGILYFSRYDGVAEIQRLDMNDAQKPLEALPISMELTHVQGGDIYDGKLFIATNDGKAAKSAYVVDLLSGETELFCQRDMGNGFTEAEGMTVFPFEDGTLFHFVDVATSVFIRSYKWLDLE